MEGWPPAFSEDHNGVQVNFRWDLGVYAASKLVRGADFCSFILDEFHTPVYDTTLLSVMNNHMFYVLWSELNDADS
jgi:hypothetical protein